MRRAGILAGTGLVLALVLWWLVPAYPVAQPEPAPAVQPPAVAIAGAGLPSPSSADVFAETPRLWREVSCALTVEPIRGYKDLRVVMFDGEDSEETIAVAADIRGDDLRFSAPTADGAGLVRLYGYEQAPLIWWTEDDGTIGCTFSRDPELAEPAILRVLAPRPEGMGPDEVISVMLCMQLYRLIDDDRFEARLEAGDCDVMACRRHEAVTACGESQTVHLKVGVTQDVELRVPDFAPAGVDATFLHEDEEIIVGPVQLGSKTAEAGLKDGDRVLAIDGQAVGGLDFRQRRQAMVGPEGSLVVLEVRGGDGELYDVEVERAFVNF